MTIYAARFLKRFEQAILWSWIVDSRRSKIKLGQSVKGINKGPPAYVTLITSAINAGG
ncbi:hypothetical protein SAMN05421750_12114 [Agrobacterium pusense]|nr:hypothetical protein SAMN05421750_12114 [Agrobacterium pusense]